MQDNETLHAVIKEWETLAPLEWGRLRAGLGYFISKYNPRRTMAIDHQDRIKASRLLMRKAVEFFSNHGFSVVCIPDQDKPEDFGIALAE